MLLVSQLVVNEEPTLAGIIPLEPTRLLKFTPDIVDEKLIPVRTAVVFLFLNCLAVFFFSVPNRLLVEETAHESTEMHKVSPFLVNSADPPPVELS